MHVLVLQHCKLFNKKKSEMLSDVGGGGLASVLDVQSLFFLLKKIGFAR